MNERRTSIKGLPLTELSLTAVASIVDVYEDEETGRQLPVVEMEVLNQEDWDKFSAPKHEANRCAICGHGLKISCAVTHKTTGNGYYIGRDCAAKITELQRFGDIIKGATVALAQRIACDKREADFLSKNPDTIGIITWSKRPNASRISRDICEKLRRFGSISDKQVALLEKIRQQDIDRRAKATGKASNGRQAIKGTVMKVTVSASDFDEKRMIAKVVVDCGNGVRLMGNLPEYMAVTELIYGRVADYLRNPACETWTHDVIKKGDVIELTASVTPSDKDDLFGFWKRPSKFNITDLAPPPLPPPGPTPEQIAEAEMVKFRDIVCLDQQLLKELAENGKLAVTNPQLWKDNTEESLWQAAERANLSDEQAGRFVRSFTQGNLFKKD